MSILIKGMEMPETCKLCYLSEFDPGFYAYVCKPTGIRIDYDMAKIDRPRTICPLVPVPPHGRLVDADKLMQEMRLFIKENMLSRDDARELLETIKDAPTIIPAEEGE